MATKLVTKNKKALFNYHVEERLETGIVLTGSEVKSLREGKANLVDAFASIRHGEVFLLKLHISPYAPAAQLNHEPTRTRKLLLHKQQIDKVLGKLHQKGYTLIPLSIYFKEGRAKIELGLCRGKAKHDKRESIKKRESSREMARAVKRN